MLAGALLRLHVSFFFPAHDQRPGPSARRVAHAAPRTAARRRPRAHGGPAPWRVRGHRPADAARPDRTRGRPAAAGVRPAAPAPASPARHRAALDPRRAGRATSPGCPCAARCGAGCVARSAGGSAAAEVQPHDRVRPWPRGATDRGDAGAVDHPRRTARPGGRALAEGLPRNRPPGRAVVRRVQFDVLRSAARGELPRQRRPARPARPEDHPVEPSGTDVAVQRREPPSPSSDLRERPLPTSGGRGRGCRTSHRARSTARPGRGVANAQVSRRRPGAFVGSPQRGERGVLHSRHSPTSR